MILFLIIAFRTLAPCKGMQAVKGSLGSCRWDSWSEDSGNQNPQDSHSFAVQSEPLQILNVSVQILSVSVPARLEVFKFG